MCLEKISEKKIAEEDIVVYKYLEKSFILKGPYVVSGNNCVAIVKGEKLIGKISINYEGNVFICHNNIKFDGAKIDNKFGFKYSWVIDSEVTSVKVNYKELLFNTIITPFRCSIVEIGKSYKSNLKKQLDLLSGYVITQGLHSFKNYYTRLNNFINVKCIIPKGSEYYEGFFNNKEAYASNKLTYLEIIE